MPIVHQDHGFSAVAPPGQLFCSTQKPVCLWFSARDKRNGQCWDRRKKTLFIDARKMGTIVDLGHRELRPEELRKIADTYPGGRGEVAGYENAPGFCASATIEENRKHDHVLTPGRSVGAEELGYGNEEE